MYGNHFEFQELVSTETGLPNSVSTSSHLANLASLWDTLNYLREKLGAPVYVNSAFRTPAVNKQVGGAKRSLHMQGRAADIRPKDMSLLPKLWEIVLEYDTSYGLSEKIRYDNFIHIAI